MKSENTGSCDRCGESLVGKRIDARYCGQRCRLLATKRRLKIRAGAFVVGESRNCVECGKSFKVAFSRHVFCSDACSGIAYRRRTGGTKNRQCQICDKEFTPNSSMHWLCSRECIRVRQRHQRLATNYGLTSEAFEKLLRKQGGGCAVCRISQSDRWAVDHDHACCAGNSTCGKCIRGILCFPCNQALGLFRDSPDTLRRALAYITNSNEPGQPGSVYTNNNAEKAA
jgi:hypothetical protein